MVTVSSWFIIIGYFRCPLYTFHTILSAMQLDHGQINFKSIFPYHWLRSSWYHYLSLIDINYCGGFVCPKCGDQPMVVVCDATSLAFRRRLLPMDSEQHVTDEPDLLRGRYKIVIAIIMFVNFITLCSSIHERVFIDDHKCRLLLKTYAKTASDSDILSRYLDSDLDDLMAYLTKHSPTLADLIEHLERPIPCPSTCASLFTDLSTTSPVCALVPPTPEVNSLIDELCTNGLEVRKFPKQWQFLQDHVPILHDLICKFGPQSTSLPSEFRPLVLDMVHKAQLPFLYTPQHPNVPFSGQSKNLHSYFPHLPVLWDRRKYKSDKHNDISSCTKLYRGHPSLLPGIFTIICPHGMLVILFNRTFQFEFCCTYLSINVYIHVIYMYRVTAMLLRNLLWFSTDVEL